MLPAKAWHSAASVSARVRAPLPAAFMPPMHPCAGRKPTPRAEAFPSGIIASPRSMAHPKAPAHLPKKRRGGRHGVKVPKAAPYRGPFLDPHQNKGRVARADLDPY